MSFFIITEGNSQISMCQALSEALSHVIPLNVNNDPASFCLGDLENQDACSALSLRISLRALLHLRFQQSTADECVTLS